MKSIRTFSAFIIIIVCLASCRSSQSSVCKSVRLMDSVVTVYKDSFIKKTLIKDSVAYKDSVTLVVDSTGKVILRDRWHYIYRDRQSGTDIYKSKLDSVLKNQQTDTVYVSQEHEVQSVSSNDRVLICLGKIFVFILISIFIILFCVRFNSIFSKL